MFKYLILLAAVGMTMVAARSPPSSAYRPSAHHVVSGDDAHAEVRQLHSNVHEHGFDYALETSNGIQAKSAGDEHGNVHGDFEWVSPEGEHVKVTYIADENGYQPQSNLLPTPPPIPDAILRALEYIRTHPPKDEPSYHHQGSAPVARYSSFKSKSG